MPVIATTCEKFIEQFVLFSMKSNIIDYLIGKNCFIRNKLLFSIEKKCYFSRFVLGEKLF